MQILCINTCATKHILYENYWLGDNFLLIGYVICKIYFQGKKRYNKYINIYLSTASKAKQWNKTIKNKIIINLIKRAETKTIELNRLFTILRSIERSWKSIINHILNSIFFYIGVMMHARLRIIYIFWHFLFNHLWGMWR